MWFLGLILFGLGAVGIFVAVMAAMKLVNMAAILVAIIAVGLLISGAVFMGCGALRDDLLYESRQKNKEPKKKRAEEDNKAQSQDRITPWLG